MSELVRAASVIPLSESDGRPTILWARRTDGAPALAGFHVVPGGVVDDADRTAPNDGGEDVASRVAALRELFEEVGILIVDGEPDVGARAALRDALRDNPREGHERLRALGLRWRTSSLTDAGRWVTPSYVPVRFDTRFFVLRMEAPVPPDPDLFELEHAEWIETSRALARWARAEVRIAPPLASVLRVLASRGVLDAAELRAVRGANGEESHRFEIVPWVQMLPLRTPTLPPATHTNAFLVGSGRAVLVEPATPYRDEIDRALAWIEEARASGIEPIAIVATHHHADHVGGARALAGALSLPLWAHRRTAERLPELEFARWLDDGERIELDGPEPVVLRALHTPGHAPGHLCLIEERSGAMIAGDMVAGVGTILVEPKDGDMRAYLASLERMASEEPTVLLPAHGGPLESRTTIDRYVRHRLERERKVLEALAQHRGRPASAADLVPVAYDDAPRTVWPLAAMSTEAHLVKLEQDGRVRRVEGGWTL